MKIRSLWILCILLATSSLGCSGGEGSKKVLSDDAAPATPPASAGSEVAVTSTVPAQEVEAPEDIGPYVIPNADPAALLDFINELANREPNGATEAEQLQDFRQMMTARLNAADRILAVSQVDAGLREATIVSQIDSLRTLANLDDAMRGQFETFVDSLMNGDNAKLALLGRVGKFQHLLDRYGRGEANDGEEVLGELRTVLANELAGYSEFLATQFAAVVLQERGEPDRASEALRLVGQRFQDSTDPSLADQAKQLLEDVEFRGKVIQATLGKEEDVKELLRSAAQKLSTPDEEVLATTVNAAQMLEYSGQFSAAKSLFQAIRKSFDGNSDKSLVDMAQRTAELANKRLGLIGEKAQLKGNLLNGVPFRWSDLQGRVVLIDFWAAYSAPWHVELPNLRDAYQKFHERGFDIVGVNLDESPQDAYAFLREQPLPWKTIIDDTAPGFANPTAFEFGVQAVPFFVLVGRDGVVVEIHSRGPRLLEQIEKLLSQEVPSATQQGNASDRTSQMRTRFVGAVTGRQDDSEDVSLRVGDQLGDLESLDESIDLESVNPYAPDPSMTASELVQMIQQMKNRPRSIQRRKGFSAGVVQAAELVLGGDASPRLKTIALLAKFEYLHREAAFGDTASEAALRQSIANFGDDADPKVVIEIGFLRLEQELLSANDGGTQSLPALLDRVAGFFSAATTSERHLRMASATIAAVNRLDDGDQRESYFQQFGKQWAGSSSAELARYGRKLVAAPAGSDAASTLVGQDVELRGITVDGVAFDWNKYRGQVVLVDFWATWCGPCRQAMPELKKLFELHQNQGFSVVGISMDEDQEALADYLKENELPWAILFGTETRALSEKYNPQSLLPAMLLVGRDGKVLAASSNLGQISRSLEQALGQ